MEKKQQQHQQNLLTEDSPPFFSTWEFLLAWKKKKQNKTKQKTKAFTQSIRANKLLFPFLEKKYTICHSETLIK